MSSRDSGSIHDEEQIEIEVRKPLSTVISVRFGAKELADLREEARFADRRIGTFIKESVTAYIATRQAARSVEFAFTGPGIALIGLQQPNESSAGDIQRIPRTGDWDRVDVA
jgi:hypothetical protein